MSKIKITVTKVSEKTTKGNFIHTLKSEGQVVKVLGQDMIGQGLTYFVALKGPAKVDSSEIIDLDKFDIVEREFTPEPDEETGETRTLMLKWLYPKRP
jgi:hypothetical protein